jgi:hypothetical protein
MAGSSFLLADRRPLDRESSASLSSTVMSAMLAPLYSVQLNRGRARDRRDGPTKVCSGHSPVDRCLI